MASNTTIEYAARVRLTLQREIYALHGTVFGIQSVRPLPLYTMIDDLWECNLLSVETRNATRMIFSLCSSALHDVEMPQTAAEMVREVAPKLVMSLQELMGDAENLGLIGPTPGSSRKRTSSKEQEAIADRERELAPRRGRNFVEKMAQRNAARREAEERRDLGPVNTN